MTKECGGSEEKPIGGEKKHHHSMDLMKAFISILIIGLVDPKKLYLITHQWQSLPFCWPDLLIKVGNTMEQTLHHQFGPVISSSKDLGQLVPNPRLENFEQLHSKVMDGAFQKWGFSPKGKMGMSRAIRVHLILLQIGHFFAPSLNACSCFFLL